MDNFRAEIKVKTMAPALKDDFNRFIYGELIEIKPLKPLEWWLCE
jgi:hypothetical protein